MGTLEVTLNKSIILNIMKYYAMIEKCRFDQGKHPLQVNQYQLFWVTA